MKRSAGRALGTASLTLLLVGVIAATVALSGDGVEREIAHAEGADWEWHTVKLSAVAVPEPAPPAVPTVFGTDDRIQLTESAPPVARLLVLGADGISRQCTGVFVAEIALLTSADCLFNTSTRQPAKAVKVIPGVFDATEPFGSALATEFSVLRGYVPGSTAASTFGLAVVRVAKSAFGSSLRPFEPVITYDDGQVWDISVLVTLGYPAEMPRGSLYGQVAEGFTTTSESFRTFLDMTPGMEGSPLAFAGIYLGEDFEEYRVMAGQVGLLQRRGEETTVALRFTSEHIQALNDWCEPLACTIAGQRGPYRLFAPGTARVRPGPQLPPANLVHESLDLPAVGASVLQAAKVFPAELYR